MTAKGAKQKEPDRWEPDLQIVDAALAVTRTRVPLTAMRPGDRAVLVLGLARAGLTAELIAKRTNCSERLVIQTRGEDCTVAVALWQEDTERLEGELRTEQCQHGATKQKLSERDATIIRLRSQLDELLDKLVTAGKIDTFPRCGHPRVRYNTYSHQGTDRCRQCRTDWQSERRKALRAV